MTLQEPQKQYKIRCYVMSNKDQARNKKKQKRALAAARRRNAMPSPQQRAQAKAEAARVAARRAAESFDETQHLFWMCHGVNFLVSDYENGTWTPLFEGIYEGRMPSPADVGRTIMTHFGPDAETWPPAGMQAMAWTMQPKATVYVYYQVALKKALEAKVAGSADEVVRKPANAYAWDTFNLLRTELAKRQDTRRQGARV